MNKLQKVLIDVSDIKDGVNEFFNIGDIPLGEEQKKWVLEWFARKLYVLTEEGSGEPDYHHKSYDPLYIEGNVAHSYVFDLTKEGGRHHNFINYQDLENKLMRVGINDILNKNNDGKWIETDYYWECDYCGYTNIKYLNQCENCENKRNEKISNQTKME